MNIQELEARNMKIVEIINSMQELLKQNENHRISNENQENHGNHEIKLDSQSNHENHRIPFDNHENEKKQKK